MSPMPMVSCSFPQAPHPSQVPMPTKLCPFGDIYKPNTIINNNNHYNDNRFCCPMIGNGDSSNINDKDQGILLVNI